MHRLVEMTWLSSSFGTHGWQRTPVRGPVTESRMKATSQLVAPMHLDTAVLLAAMPVVLVSSSPWGPLMAPHTCNVGKQVLTAVYGPSVAADSTVCQSAS
jgi:hypothetical protein